MRRYLRVYRTFVGTSLARELEFRANFFAKLMQQVVWIAFFLVVLLLVYTKTDQVGGWNRGEAIVLAATVFTMNAIAGAFFFSLNEIPEHVRRGTLDFVITKPIDTQFWISVRRFNFDQISAMVVGIGMLAYGVHASNLHPSWLDWLSYVTLVGVSLTVFYSMMLGLMTTGIWFVRVDNLWVLADSIVSVARFPIDIYSSGIQRFFTFVVPLAFLGTLPARQLVSGAVPTQVVGGLVWAVTLFLASRLFWNRALRSYSSASS